jgi:predicted amidohydrolase YtcJ
MTTVIYSARIIHTMNPSRPTASHVAVRGDRILGTGSLQELVGWGEYTLDERFADKVLLPGFVEGHAHLMEGAFWQFVYCGYFDRTDPHGKTWSGVRSVEALVQRLQTAQAKLADPNAPLMAWGFDPIYFNNVRCSRQDLDRVSSTRPVGLLHASIHILNANTKALEESGLLRQGIEHPGIGLGPDGFPTGELKGPDAMTSTLLKLGLDRGVLNGDVNATLLFGKLAVRCGVTTATDLANPMTPDAVESLLQTTGRPDYPLRVVPLQRLAGDSVRTAIDYAVTLRKRSTDQLRLGRIKVVADGSIQGFSARMRWPGYYNGAPQGLWYTAPETMLEAYRLALQNGIPIHTHTNGDAATALALDCMETALCEHPVPDHRFTLQHCQLADAAQFRRMQKLGMCVNLFANHHYFWGDQHYSLTVGPERAERMNACATALTSGVPFAIHSDAPVTPLGPLFTAWCAVNRLTASGRCLGAAERISVSQALRAITLGAAYTLHLDGEIGSIEVGKRADFAVLNDDPYEVAPAALKDVGVWGAVQGGRVFQAPHNVSVA